MATRRARKTDGVARGPTPPHIAEYPCGKAAHDRLYVDDGYGPSMFVPKWRRPRIPSETTTELGAHRLLPHAPNFEYGGWTTRRCIFYATGDEYTAPSNNSVRTAFHSHPTQYEYADMPSTGDVYSLLKWSTVRHVIVGAHSFLVLEKTAETLPVVERLFEWEARNQVSACRSLCHDHGNWVAAYCDTALQMLMASGNITYEDYIRHWPEVLGAELRIRVRKFGREAKTDR